MKNNQLKKALENVIKYGEAHGLVVRDTMEQIQNVMAVMIGRIYGVIDMIEEEDFQYPPYIPPYGDQILPKDYKLKTDDKAGGEG